MRLERVKPSKANIAAFDSNHVHTAKKVTEVAREYGLPRTTVSTWKKQSDKIIQDAGKSTPKRKRLRQSPHIEVEQSLILWLREMHSLDVPPPITYMMLCLKAEL